MRRRLVLLTVFLACCTLSGQAWGVRAHDLINRVAVRTIPDDGPVFLKAHEEWVAYLASIPDTWRRPSEPFLRILEDPNHGWFREQFSEMTEVPRSRYAFLTRLADLQKQQQAAGQSTANLTNVRWTGTLPFAAVEGYERMLAAMRRYRALAPGDDRSLIEREIAFYMGWTGHYTGDGAQPLHDTIHHDGWQGDNPKGYTTDPRIHGRFETQFVDLMKLDAADVQPRVAPARVLADPFDAILAHLDLAATHVEEVYQLDRAGALADPTHPRARALVIERVASGAALLRDLAHTAWVRSGERPATDPGGNTIVPTHPAYDPTTGSAPAFRVPAGAAATPVRPGGADDTGTRRFQPIAFIDPLVGKNFFVLEAIASLPPVRAALQSNEAARALRDDRVSRMAGAAERCGVDPACHAAAFRWTAEDTMAARGLLAQLPPTALEELAGQLRRSGLYVRFAQEPSPELVGRAWTAAAAGLNRIIEVYGLGAAPMYPKIDSVSYDPSSDFYRRLIVGITDVVDDRRDTMTLFFEPSLQFARELLVANRRDEAARHEPLHLGDNAATVRRLSSIDWQRYRYPAILVPGAGADRDDVALDPGGRLRLALAASRYRAGLAPILIVSGGYVHPAQTRYAEAIEMKRALVAEFGVPGDAILVDPHARHTTTNLRNAARQMFRYGIPTDRPSLITTDRWQSAYIESPEFRDRCKRELGYQPHVPGRRLSRFDQEFQPTIESLHLDARDPLDP